ncbi:unnamed protein product [Heligmosomoides polygyrus]|uniref:Reverse transcriptase domain-containing protein n=1 Tax=Heligmosomoides polygyrus TaxID=6339 RepID=A0A183FMR9_HELPZ|nr:unnamed protein product [Heligmosomoides polygyrus]
MCFLADCGSFDAKYAVHLLLDKYGEKQKPLHFAFLNLEKAFDRVPTEILYGTRCENMVSRKSLLSGCAFCTFAQGVECECQLAPRWNLPHCHCCGASALSSQLTVVVTDAISRALEVAAPWTTLHADDAMLVCEVKTETER